MEDKKKVILGVSGGISAYKTVYVASGLKKMGYFASEQEIFEEIRKER